MGRLDYEVQLGVYDAALERAPHVIAESHALVRVWMLTWISSLMAGMSVMFTGDTDTLDRIDALIASTGVESDRVGRATRALARGDVAGARALFPWDALSDRLLGYLTELARRVLQAQLAVAEGDPQRALEAITTAADLARQSNADGLLWSILARQAQIEDALGREPEASAHWDEAQALRAKIAATVQDPAHRSAFLTGRLASHLGLAR